MIFWNFGNSSSLQGSPTCYPRFPEEDLLNKTFQIHLTNQHEEWMCQRSKVRDSPVREINKAPEGRHHSRPLHVVITWCLLCFVFGEECSEKPISHPYLPKSADPVHFMGRFLSSGSNEITCTKWAHGLASTPQFVSFSVKGLHAYPKRLPGPKYLVKRIIE